MTAQFSRPGAIDLSAFRQPAAAPSTGSAGSTSAAFVIDVTTEAQLRSEVVERSLSVVVLVSFWSPASAASVQINTTLENLAAEFAGRFVLAKVDVAAQPALATALGIPQAPLVVAALRGQLAPLLQEPLPEAQMRELVLQVLDAAATAGVAAGAPPVPEPAGGPIGSPEPPPRHGAAEDALVSGDFAAAIEAYRQALAEAPGDVEASAGLARAQLLQRVSTVDVTSAKAAAADRLSDVDAQTLAADIDLLEGAVEEAFARLVETVRRTTGDERDAARKHLVDLFTVVGDDDPRVAKARQRLTSALF